MPRLASALGRSYWLRLTVVCSILVPGQFQASCTSSKPRFECEETICQGRASMLQSAFRAASARSFDSNNSKPEEAKRLANELNLKECPVDRDELGRHTWALLHTLGAYFPDEPSLAQQSHASVLLLSLSLLYPCSICADDFAAFVNDHPPDTSSRKALSLWLCRLHNSVNNK